MKLTFILASLLLLSSNFLLASGLTSSQVARVIDGDTIVLIDGRHVRLLGLNTPELARKNKPSEPGGTQAKRWLTQRIEGSIVRLEIGQQAYDKYGRLLAHIFDTNDNHINLELISNGIATISIIPPNVKYAQSFLTAQQTAIAAKLGLWNIKKYQVQPLQNINLSNAHGWHRILVKPYKILRYKKSSRLIINNQFYLKIPKNNLQYFASLHSYLGKELEVSGWISTYKGRKSMRLLHSSAMSQKK